MKHLFNTMNCLDKEQMEGYLKGTQSREERFRIENHLLDCELCSAAIEGFEQMGYLEEDADFLNTFHQELEAKKGDATVRQLQPNRDRFLWRRIAAAVLVLMIPFSSYMYWNSQSTNRMTDGYFSNLEINDNFRGIDAIKGGDTDLDNAVASYKAKQYATSIPQFEAYLERQPEDAEAILYAGIACLESGQLQKADDYLTTVRINSERLFEDSTWYLVLAKIKSAKTAEAIQLLEELIKKNETGFYAEQARQLLFQLKK